MSIHKSVILPRFTVHAAAPMSMNVPHTSRTRLSCCSGCHSRCRNPLYSFDQAACCDCRTKRRQRLQQSSGRQHVRGSRGRRKAKPVQPTWQRSRSQSSRSSRRQQSCQRVRWRILAAALHARTSRLLQPCRTTTRLRTMAATSLRSRSGSPQRPLLRTPQQTTTGRSAH